MKARECENQFLCAQYAPSDLSDLSVLPVNECSDGGGGGPGISPSSKAGHFWDMGSGIRCGRRIPTYMEVSARLLAKCSTVYSIADTRKSRQKTIFLLLVSSSGFFVIFSFSVLSSFWHFSLLPAPAGLNRQGRVKGVHYPFFSFLLSSRVLGSVHPDPFLSYPSGGRGEGKN